MFFDYNNSSLSIPKEFGIILAVISALFLLFIYNSYWKTIDGGLAPEKFSQKNLAVRDIVLRYTSKAYLFLMFLLLMLQVIEESGNVFVITGAWFFLVMFVGVSVCFFRVNKIG